MSQRVYVQPLSNCFVLTVACLRSAFEVPECIHSWHFLKSLTWDWFLVVTAAASSDILWYNIWHGVNMASPNVEKHHYILYFFDHLPIKHRWIMSYMFILRNSFQIQYTVHARDITPTVNHANCLDQEPVRHTYGNLIGGIRLHLNPSLFICSLSSGLKVCMGNAQATMS